MQLTTLSGQLVAEKTDVSALDIGDQPAGIYYVLFTDELGQVLQRSKIVKE